MTTSQPSASNRTKLIPEIQTAKNWYIWLWISPAFTIPTLIILVILIYVSSGSRADNYLMFAVFGSAFWHLVLLLPALAGVSEFVRWHGRQALILAGVRTAMVMLILFLESPLIYGFGILILSVIFIGGNLWGQGQARRGDCSLMRWMGHGVGLPLPVAGREPALEVPSERPSGDAESPANVDSLVETIRFASDPDKRRAALVELERLGFVEPLS